MQGERSSAIPSSDMGSLLATGEGMLGCSERQWQRDVGIYKTERERCERWGGETVQGGFAIVVIQL